MINKKIALANAIKTLSNSEAAVDEFIHNEGCEGLIFQELSVLIPVSAARLAEGDRLDFEDPNVQSKYIRDLIMLEGSLSICKKLVAAMEEDNDE